MEQSRSAICGPAASAIDGPLRVAKLDDVGPAPVLVVCEHASKAIPARFGSLGLGDRDRASHIAWDLGALDLAQALALRLQAPLLSARVSRLVFDLNRPPGAPDAIAERSESTDIPGNIGLTEAERQARVDTVHAPWVAALTAAIDAGRPDALISVHSFTPVFAGMPRTTEVGIIHDRDARLADAVLAHANATGWERNRPYGPDDGVTHTLRTFAEPRGLLALMIEIRNDLLRGAAAVDRMADTLAGVLVPSLAACAVGMRERRV
ncbi:MAG: N-formylglutamate amidohydrolase [Rhodospirillales bacterium]|nr:N-formylglutamate amidohydrolase [Rhodospirillales bacterium]